MDILYAPNTRYRVHNSLSRLRDVVNYPGPRFEALVEERKRWSLLCVAMDVATDSETAIQTYIDTPDADIGYLHYYGLMDSWVVQQDAVDTIRHELLGIPKIKWSTDEQHPLLVRNRRLRNKLTSHPMGAKAGNGSTVVNGIIQFRMRKWYLAYMEWQDGGYTQRSVDLKECIAVQRKCITQLIDGAAADYGKQNRVGPDAAL